MATVEGLGHVLLFKGDSASAQVAFAHWAERLAGKIPDAQVAEFLRFASGARVEWGPELRGPSKGGRPVVGFMPSRLGQVTGQLGERWHPRSVIHRLQEVGATCVMLPPVISSQHDGVLSAAVDAVIFAGGEHLQPAMYRRVDSVSDDPTKIAFDRSQDRFLKHLFFESDAVIGGICLGAQRIAVTLGQTLLHETDPQQAERHIGRAPRTGEMPRPAIHPVTLERGSALAHATGTGCLRVMSLHEQAIAPSTGHEIEVTGWSPGCVAEVVEHTGRRRSLVLGVLFHPELMKRYSLPFFKIIAERASRRSRPVYVTRERLGMH